MTEQKNFLGIPVNGDITRGSTRVPQAKPEELQEEIRKLLEFKSFTKLKWRQYTPYFNDGDPCEFGVSDVGILVPSDDAEDVGDYEDGYVDLPNTRISDYYDEKAQAALREFVGVWDAGRYDWKTRTWSGETGWVEKPKHPKMIEQATKVARLISGGAHENYLLETFGDHAVIYLSKDSIDVEFYEHD